MRWCPRLAPDKRRFRHWPVPPFIRGRAMFRVLSAAAIVVGLLGLVAPAPAQDAKMKFELFKGKDDQFRWRLRAANGAGLATAGQGYKAAADARHGIELLQKAGTDDKATFELDEYEKKEHRWRVFEPCPCTSRRINSATASERFSGSLPTSEGHMQSTHVGPIQLSAGFPRVLFASYHCYHDPASGAAVCTRDLFAALAARGWKCGAITGPYLDDPAAVPIGETLRGRAGTLTAHGTAGPSAFCVHTVAAAGEFPVTVFEPAPPAAARPPSLAEAGAFLALVADVIRRFRPKVVLTYGGDPASRGVTQLARRVGAKVVFWLHNFAYSDSSVFAGCDAIVVPSNFSREHYRRAVGLDCVVLPPVVDPDRVLVDRGGGGK